MTTLKVSNLVRQINTITGIYRCLKIESPKKFNYQNESQDYNESYYKEDVNQIINMKRHPVITKMGFYIHPTNIKE
jgi:hypothetical protein